ncbi:Oidioi.mRNA.OKI2018_I69.PAR.g9062.t1.cds [Oikopleura dioica]|uniref:Oidioi.mRNA.OKI2018_I69.PAR.g9062.t1.cds n=1 Tax=Oikopleura dioica TaxID=34765 RepID=A0ABN7RIT0_OIKDI|nr:Oidioi.mRNA.OKI2018_I69.PAR.g9062.t1.cds [Oikopleura dioica]
MGGEPVQKSENQKTVQNFLKEEQCEGQLSEAFLMLDQLDKNQRSLTDAKERYQLTERKALTNMVSHIFIAQCKTSERPGGFYENKLELLTETIIYYERLHHTKQREFKSFKNELSTVDSERLEKLVSKYRELQDSSSAAKN